MIIMNIIVEATMIVDYQMLIILIAIVKENVSEENVILDTIADLEWSRYQRKKMKFLFKQSKIFHTIAFLFILIRFCTLICRCIDTDCVRIIRCNGDYDCPDSVPDCNSDGECTNYECKRGRPCQVSNIINIIRWKKLQNE